MPIELRTGLPGAGKSLGAVEDLMLRRKKEPDRVLYQHGINGLRDGLAIPLDADGVRNWKDLPAGSVLYVDEVQKLMPASRSSDVPQWIRDLSEHRHLGLDFVFVTQHPSLIHNYVRTLVDRHIHTVRSYGTTFIERYSWPLCVGDPNSKSNRKSCEAKSRHAMSKEAMGAYKSAELHTIKPKIPKFLKLALCVALALPVLIFLGYRIMRHLGDKAVPQSSSVSLPGDSSAVGSTASKAVLSKDDWVKRQIPRVAGLPWSAPIFDDQKAQAQPDLYCAKFEGDDGRVDNCTCLTEQGTKAAVPHAMCLAFAEGGVYNPYRAPVQRQSPVSQPIPGDPSRPQNPKDFVEGRVAGVGVSKTNHADRDTAVPYTPPEYHEWNSDPFGGGHPSR